MQVKVSNFKAFYRPTVMNLRRINVFMGSSGLGKSTLSDFLDLIAKNHHLERCDRADFPSICNFDPYLDWRHYVNKGVLGKPVVIGRSVDLLGMPLSVEVHYAHTPTIHRADDENIKCAEIIHLSIYHEEYPIVVWNKDERKIYHSNFYRVMQLGLKKMGKPLKKEWQQQCGLPEVYAKEMSLKLFNEFLEVYPREMFVDVKRKNFRFDLGEIHRNFHVHIKDRGEFFPVLISAQHLFILVMDAMTTFLSDTYILDGSKKPVLDQFLSKEKTDAFYSFGSCTLSERTISDSEGSYYTKQMFVNRCGVDVPLEMAGSGTKRIASWVHEIMEIKQILAEPLQRNFVQKSKVVILKDPERDLSPNELLSWFGMWRLVMENLPNVYWIIETKSPLIAEFLQFNIRREEIKSEWVRIFAFTVWNVKGLPFNEVDINENGELSGTISHHFDDQVIFRRDSEFIDKYVALAGVLGEN